MPYKKVTHSDCQLLDEYLNGDLSPAVDGLFREHLAACDNCQDAVDQQQWLDQILRQSNDLAPLPAELAEISVGQPPRLVYWRAAMATAVAMAATLLLAFTLWPDSQHETQIPVAEKAEPTATNPQPEAEFALRDKPRATPAATFVAEEDVIVVAVKSDSPEVTIIQVYPTAQARSRWRREALLQTSSVSFPGG